jgi:hypothetical protein
MLTVFVARLICSDLECAAEVTADAQRLPELERLICDCGCALEVIAWPDWLDEPGEVVALRVAGSRLRHAA